MALETTNRQIRSRVGHWLNVALWGRRALSVGLAIALGMGLVACRGNEPGRDLGGASGAAPIAVVSEVAPPAVFDELRQPLESYQPQVSILSPRPDEVIESDRVAVQFSVQDFPLFKNADLGLGPHLHVFVDDQPYIATYDISQPLQLDNLAAGSHTIRAFASRPWHESFKNDGAFAQVTFHVFTKTERDRPDPSQPLLTYSRPQGSYGAEPIMLDFYLTNAPLHLVARQDNSDAVKDWQIRCTVNGESFMIEDWQPIYLEGFHPGKNWVQLELLDEDGLPIANAYNNTARIITYEPGGQDALSRLVRGELTAAEAIAITTLNPPPVIEPEPVPEEITEPLELVVPPAENSDSDRETSSAPGAIAPVSDPVRPEFAEPDQPASASEEGLMPEISDEPVLEEAVPSLDSAIESTVESTIESTVDTTVDALAAEAANEEAADEERDDPAIADETLPLPTPETTTGETMDDVLNTLETESSPMNADDGDAAPMEGYPLPEVLPEGVEGAQEDASQFAHDATDDASSPSGIPD